MVNAVGPDQHRYREYFLPRARTDMKKYVIPRKIITIRGVCRCSANRFLHCALIVRREYIDAF